MVALMSSDKACWNEQLVDSLFLPLEAQQIKGIPLCLVPQSDHLYWSFIFCGRLVQIVYLLR